MKQNTRLPPEFAGNDRLGISRARLDLTADVASIGVMSGVYDGVTSSVIVIGVKSTGCTVCFILRFRSSIVRSNTISTAQAIKKQHNIRQLRRVSCSLMLKQAEFAHLNRFT